MDDHTIHHVLHVLTNAHLGSWHNSAVSCDPQNWGEWARNYPNILPNLLKFIQFGQKKSSKWGLLYFQAIRPFFFNDFGVDAKPQNSMCFICLMRKWRSPKSWTCFSSVKIISCQFSWVFLAQGLFAGEQNPPHLLQVWHSALNRKVCLGAMAKLSWRTALVVLFGGVLAPLLSAENRMMMMLHLWLPCVRFLPSTEDKLVVLLEKYFYLEKAWSPSSFEPDDIPEIHAEDYSLPKLLELSVNGRKPVIVRGLMNHSKAFSEAGKAEWVQKYQNFNVLQLFMNPGNLAGRNHRKCGICRDNNLTLDSWRHFDVSATPDVKLIIKFYPSPNQNPNHEATSQNVVSFMVDHISQALAISILFVPRSRWQMLAVHHHRFSRVPTEIQRHPRSSQNFIRQQESTTPTSRRWRRWPSENMWRTFSKARPAML